MNICSLFCVFCILSQEISLDGRAEITFGCLWRMQGRKWAVCLRKTKTPACFEQNPCMKSAKPLHLFKKSPACFPQKPCMFLQKALHPAPISRSSPDFFRQK